MSACSISRLDSSAANGEISEIASPAFSTCTQGCAGLDQPHATCRPQGPGPLPKITRPCGVFSLLIACRPFVAVASRPAAPTRSALRAGRDAASSRRLGGLH